MKDKTQIRYDSAYYCPNNFASKFKKLLDARYSDYKEHKRRSAFENEYLDRFQKDPDVNSISSSTKQWFALAQRPSIEKLMNICELLDCDIDYFLTDQKNFKKETQHASETTELNYKTIEKIEKYSPELKQLIDRLVLHSNEDNLLKLLNAILTYSLHSHHAYIKIDVPGANIIETNDIEEKLVNYSPSNPLNDISKKMLKYSVTSSLDEVLTDTYNDYIEDGNLLLKERLKKRSEVKKAAVKRVLEKLEAGLEPTAEEIHLLYGKSIGNHTPTPDERYNQIDEEVSHLYELYKEPTKNS